MCFSKSSLKFNGSPVADVLQRRICGIVNRQQRLVIVRAVDLTINLRRPWFSEQGRISARGQLVLPLAYFLLTLYYYRVSVVNAILF
jgi:hypothetical protein